MEADAPLQFPPTLVVVHHRERRDKCSVEPLRGRKDMRFVRYPLTEPVETTGYVRLALDGPMLGEGDHAAGLLVLDATWRLAEKMDKTFASVPGRQLPRAKTAYPRVSKVHEDPTQGLATVEAIYLAYFLLGRDTSGLLESYRWADEFLTSNRDLFGFCPTG